MLTLPPSKACIATLKPPPESFASSTPTRASRARTLTLLQLTPVVGCAFHPIFLSGAPKERPFVPFSTRNAVIEDVLLL